MVEILILIALIILAVWIISAVMSIFGVIITILSWMLAGYLAGRLLRGRGYGPVGDTLLGLAGGIVGSIILRLIGLSGVGNIWLIGSILVGIIGAVVLVYAVRLVANKDFAR